MVTLIITVTISGFITHQVKLSKTSLSDMDQQSLYSLHKISTAAFVCILYFFATPLALIFLARHLLNIQSLKYTWVFAVYGYSFSSFIVFSLVYIFPIPLLRWLMLLGAGFNSMFFIFKEMKEIIEEKIHADKQKFLGVAGFLIVSHVLFMLLLRFYFLN